MKTYTQLIREFAAAMAATGSALKKPNKATPNPANPVRSMNIFNNPAAVTGDTSSMTGKPKMSMGSGMFSAKTPIKNSTTAGTGSVQSKSYQGSASSNTNSELKKKKDKT